jgi:hypothetical protein
MKILAIDQWDSRDLKSTFLKRLRTEKFDKIFIFTQNEFQFETVFDEFIYPFLGHYIETKGLNVDLITSIPPESDKSEKFKGLNIHYWDTYWLTKTHSIINAVTSNRLSLERESQKAKVNKLKFPFIMMNNRSHRFRAKLIDLLAREKLLDTAAISWNNTDKFLLNGYKFEHFDGNNRTLDEKYFTDFGGQYSLPDQFFESFAQLVSESTPNLLFFSEKISMSLLVGKPFIAAAAPGMHNYLHNRLGIKYYHEIFDYSFDFELDMNKRWEMIVQNFVKLSKLSLDQLEELQYQVQDKVEFNRNRAIEIVNDTSFMPLPIRECFDRFKLSTSQTINRHLDGVFEGLFNKN